MCRQGRTSQRPEPLVAAGAEDHFHARAAHFLDENPLDLRAGGRAATLLELLIRPRRPSSGAVNVEDHSAGVVL